MKRTSEAFLFLVLATLLSVNSVHAQTTFDTNLTANTQITWNVIDAPEQAFALYISGTNKWLAEDESQLIFTIQTIDEDITGQITLGNMTWVANDTTLAMDLTIGIWGLTPFLPGFFIEVGEENIESLNETAFSSAERVLGNYLNGTMESYFENSTINGVAYQTIVFSYVQDDTSFGEPQTTELYYDISNGVLVKCRTTYSFGVPYVLELELDSITPPFPIGWEVIAIIGIIAVAGVVIVTYRR